MAGSTPVAEASSCGPAQPTPPKSSRRSLIFGIVGVVIVVAVVIVGIFIFDETSAAIAAGSGTATITWTRAPGSVDTSTNPPQSFTGTVGGHSLVGVATFTTANPSQGTTQVGHYRGTFDGKPYALDVRVDLRDLAFVVTGTYDGQAVHAVIRAPSNPDLSSSTASFSGTIGTWKVSGTLDIPTGTDQKQTATASYTVSS
ncbi:MAG: hypothetical protein ABSB09_05400 [Acidimicrobiales bacterium]